MDKRLFYQSIFDLIYTHAHLLKMQGQMKLIFFAMDLTTINGFK